MEAIELPDEGTESKPPQPSGGWMVAGKVIFICVIVALLIAVILYEPPDDELEWCCDPCIALSTEYGGGGRWFVHIESMTEAVDIDRYEAIVLRNGTTFARMDPVSTDANDTFMFVDYNGDGRLTPGDHFIVQCEPGIQELYILSRKYDCAKGGTDWEV